MSIINDALKKVQKNMDKNQNPSDPSNKPSSSQESISSPGGPQQNPTLKRPPLPSSPGIKQDKTLKSKTSTPKSKKNRLIFLIISLLCLAGIITFYYLGIPNSISLDLKKTHKNSSQKTSRPSTDIEIKGIMMMNEKNMALIGDNIYEVGDSIQGMEIIAISIDSVQMINDGVVYKYKVNTNR